MCLPTLVEPTKVIPLTSGCRRNISASCREHVIKFNTPAGNPASAHSSIILIEVSGQKLAAFITIVFPVAMHRGAIHPIGIIAGKFHGAMPANTPMLSIYCVVSYPTEQFISAGPFIKWVIPQANSTTSVTFSTSPIASSSTFPFSFATISVSSSRCLSNSAFILKSTCTRLLGGVFDQAG